MVSQFSEAQDRYYGRDSILLDEKLAIFEGETMKQRIRTFRRFLSPRADVLEIGPGAGHILRWLKLQGHRVTGVEHSPILAQYLAGRLSVPVINAEFEAHDFAGEAFDAFCSFHVIEHVSDPLLHLIRANEVVRPGGLAFVATPNAMSWEQRAAPPLGPNFDPAHLHIFSPRSFRSACEQTGWTVIHLTTPESSGGWARVLSGMLRKLRHEDAATTAGKYARTSSSALRALAWVFQVVTLPGRFVQRKLGAGNEIFAVLQKPI